MPHVVPAEVARVLEDVGLLLVTDRRLTCVVSLITGGPVAGSWWGHPRGHDIYHACQALHDRPDVLSVKLIAGKETFVLRRLWPALLGVACAREAWQKRKLSPAARRLLRRVDREGRVELTRRAPEARLLERRLLVRAFNTHGPTGAHYTVVETWDAWRARASFEAALLPPGEGKTALEAASLGLLPG
jgi:hypothetical protein